jgi:class 3 adenylate cyclase/CHASE2 domain-containing sensor protein
VSFKGSISMKLLKRLAKSLLIGSAIGVGVALATNFFVKDLIDRLENQTYYMRYRWEFKNLPAEKSREEVDNDNSIRIIDIDERSQHKLGKYWNWDRSFHADMINALSKHDPAAIAFDVMFFDPDDRNYVARFDSLIAKCKRAPGAFAMPENTHTSLVSAIDYDERFIAATKKAGNVFHAVMMADSSDYPSFAQSQIQPRTTMAWHDSLHPSSAVLFPPVVRHKVYETRHVIDGIFPGLAQASRDIGCVNILPNSDGVIRAVPVMYGFGTNPPVYLPMSVRIVATLFKTPNREIVYKPGRYLDIGKPFKAFRDSAGVLTFSYPNVTPAQVKAILGGSPRILHCAKGKPVEVSSHLKIRKDASGTCSIDMYCGSFPGPVATALLHARMNKIVSMAEHDSLAIGPQVFVRRNSGTEWTLSAPQIDSEWTLSRLDLETIDRVDSTEFDALKPGESKLLFYAFTVKNVEGKLVSTLPVINESVLRDLCATPWSAIMSLAPGARMDFGAAVRILLVKDETKEGRDLHIVTYAGPKAATFDRYSYWDVMKDRVKGELEGKIFLVGSTVQGLFDIVSTPIDDHYPGVEVHASLVNSFLTNSFVRRLSEWQDFLILLLVAMVIGILTFFLKPLWGAIVGTAAIFAYFLIAMTVFSESRLWIEIARPILAIVITFSGVMVLRYITEEKDRKFLQSTFKQYLSPELIDIMYSSKQQPKLGGDEGVRTAFFTDIQGFSTISEKIGSPSRLVELLNEYLTEMTDILLKKHYGTLDKYEGDAIIAFFGAPVSMDDHAKQACLTALDMQTRLAELRKKWASEGDKWPAIVHEMRMRIGINTGLIVTGNMGSTTRKAYTMMGDQVNLAARLESAAKQYGVFIMISDSTREMVKNDFEVRQLDKITVVGKSEPVTVFELLAEKGKLPPELATMRDWYAKGLVHFYKQEWDRSMEALTESERLEPHRAFATTSPSAELLRYCRNYKANPPGKDWDGVNRLTSK